MNTKLLDIGIEKTDVPKHRHLLFSKSQVDGGKETDSRQLDEVQKGQKIAANSSLVDGKIFLKSKYESANKFLVVRKNKSRGQTMDWMQEEMNNISEFKSMV